MNYSEEFKSLVASTNENYIGHGNPNAKILFIGQEGASNKKEDKGQDGRNDYDRSIESNRKDWNRNIQEGIGYETLPMACTPETHKNYNPLFPYKGQKFSYRRKSGKKDKDGKDLYNGTEGTAPTWCNYQKLINRIFELISSERKPMTKDDGIDFHLLSFHIDMSGVASMKHNHENREAAYKSVLNRVALLSSDFFRHFPIVIAAVGHFPRDVYKNLINTKPYFEEVFGVELCDTLKEGKLWVNFNYKLNNNPKLLVHCPQFSASISNAFIEQIAKRVIDFANEHHINLMPEE